MYELHCPMGGVFLTRYERSVRQGSALKGIPLRYGRSYPISEFWESTFNYLSGHLNGDPNESWPVHAFIDYYGADTVRFELNEIIIMADSSNADAQFDCIQFALNVLT